MVRGGTMSPHFFQKAISLWKKGSGGPKFLDFSYFIINFQKIKKFRFDTTITSTFNFMTRVFDDLGTENRFLNSIWMCCQNNTRLILYLGAKSNFPLILSLDTYGLMDLSWQLHKGMTIVCRSYAIGHKFINPICECGVK